MYPLCIFCITASQLICQVLVNIMRQLNPKRDFFGKISSLFELIWVAALPSSYLFSAIRYEFGEDNPTVEIVCVIL